MEQEHKRDSTGRSGWHRLQLHANDAAMNENMCRFLFSALAPGHAAIVVAERGHLQIVREHAATWDLDLERAEAEGQFVPVVAEDVLPHLLIDGMPDRERFRALLKALKGRVTAEHQQLHIYGEMVGMLLDQGQEAAMHGLEELWNEVGAEERFTLLCGYPARLLTSPERAETMQQVCDHHHSLVG